MDRLTRIMRDSRSNSRYATNRLQTRSETFYLPQTIVFQVSSAYPVRVDSAVCSTLPRNRPRLLPFRFGAFRSQKYVTES